MAAGRSLVRSPRGSNGWGLVRSEPRSRTSLGSQLGYQSETAWVYCLEPEWVDRSGTQLRTALGIRSGYRSETVWLYWSEPWLEPWSGTAWVYQSEPLFLISYSCMKKSAMVDGNNYVS